MVFWNVMYVIWLTGTNTLEEPVASIFRVIQQPPKSITEILNTVRTTKFTCLGLLLKRVNKIQR
jgi:hypothetical protein